MQKKIIIGLVIIAIIVLILVYVLYKSDTKGSSGKAQQLADKAKKDADTAQQIADQAKQVAQQTSDPDTQQAARDASQHASLAQQSAQQATQHAAQASSDDDSHTAATQQAAQTTTYHLLTAYIRAQLTDAQLDSLSFILQTVTTQKYISSSGAMVSNMADAQILNIDRTTGKLLPSVGGIELAIKSDGPPNPRVVLGEYGYSGTGIRVDGSAIYGVQISSPRDMLLDQYYPLFGVNVLTTYD